jgi:hypothetical protein
VPLALVDTYTVNFVPVDMLMQLGMYVGAFFNFVALLGLGVAMSIAIGTGVVVALLAALWGAWRGAEGARFVAAGTAMFIVSLVPVLVLHAHYYDHYVCTAALGGSLAVIGLCRLCSARHWQRLAVPVPRAVVGRPDDRREGLARQHDRAARRQWLADVRFLGQGSSASHGGAGDGPFELYVPFNAVTNKLFAAGEVNEFMPGFPARVSRYRYERGVRLAPGQIVVDRPPPIPFGHPLPLWDARWEWLRRFARWPIGERTFRPRLATPTL